MAFLREVPPTTRMFEQPPFLTCPFCRAGAAFGILSIGSKILTRRCRMCRFENSEPLPSVEKDVIYLDQNALSEIFKIKSGSRRPGAPNESFWKAVEQALDRAILLQQVVCPQSDIHIDETIVFHSADDLLIAHEMLGDIKFRRSSAIIADQEWPFFEAYLEGAPPPTISFAVDDILRGKRNGWLPNLHITAQFDWSHMATGVRKHRSATADRMNALSREWASKKPTFNVALQHELDSYGPALQNAIESNHNIKMRFWAMKSHLEEKGIKAREAEKIVFDFWHWEGNEHQPENRISSYLFAALARQFAAGREKLPSPGMINDIRAVSVYGPYVNAMFLDRECANLVQEVKSYVPIRAEIFSTKTGDAFLTYLDQLAERASPEVRARAGEVYGVD